MPENITPQMDMVSSTPQEAAEHIDNAGVFGLGADVFKEYKGELQPEVDKLARPTEASKSVSNYVQQSPEHAALAMPDVDKLSYMDRQFKLIGDYVGKRRTTDEQLADMGLKKMFSPDKWTEDDDLKLDQLNTDQSEFSNYGLDGPYEQLPAQIAGGLSSMVSGVVKHKELIAASTLTGAGIGAGGGLVAGGVGALPGAAGGALTGLGYGVLGAMTIDGVNMQMGATYNELNKLRDPNGQPIQGLDDTAKRNISIGVGVGTGAIIAVVGKTVAKASPFLNTLIGPQAVKAVVMDPAKAAMKTTLFNIGKAIMAGGGGAGIQKSTEIIAAEFAKSYDGTEASYLNALNNASDQILQATMVCAGTTGLIAGTTGAAGYKQTKKNFIQAEETRFGNSRDVTPDAPLALQPPPSDIPPKGGPRSGGSGSPAVDSAIDVLHFDAAIDQINKVQNSTEMKNLSPHQLSQVRQQMLNNAEIKTIYVDKEDLTKFANNDERAKAVRDIIDPSGQAAAALNAPPAIEAHKFMELVDKYPEASELAKLSPEGPSALQAQEFLKQHNAEQARRQELLTKLGASDIDPETRATIEQALTPENPSRMYPSVFGEEEYLNQPTFTKAIESVLSESEVKSYNEAQLKARQSVVDNINEASQLEMDSILDITLEQAREAELENQLIRAENNPNLALVDKFMKPDEGFADLALNHSKKGYSAYAIDPSSLTPELREKFLNNEQLNKHKVFVKGGIAAMDAAGLMGTKDAETLLQILSQTPSREEVAAGRLAAREADLQRLAVESIDPNQTALVEAYNSVTKNHIAEMKFMREKQWPATKAGIKRIALPLPTMAELNAKARGAVQGMKLSQLNVNQFKVGERKSQRIAIESILKNEVEKAYTNKESAALNVQLAKETHIAIGKVNRALRFARRFGKKEVIQELKDAGKMYSDAADELLTAFNLNPSKKSLAEQGAYLKWVTDMAEKGQGDFQIPDRLADLRQSVNDMTVEQVIAVTDRLKNILQTAKYKNRLYKKYENIKGIQTIEAFGNKIEAEAKANPLYDPRRSEVNQDQTFMSDLERKGENLREISNILERAQHVILKFDNDNVNGLLNDLVWRRVVDAENVRQGKILELSNHAKKMIDKFGKKEFDNLASEFVTVPEFKGIKTLKGGVVTKAQLLVMELNFGNEGNLVALERYGVGRDVIRTVLDRELQHKHTEWAQQFWDIYETYKPEVAALQKKTEGTDVNWVVPQSFTARGRVYPGGFHRLMYVTDDVRQTRETTASAAELTRLDKAIQKYHAKTMTEQGHLEERVGSDKLPDLEIQRIFDGQVQIIQDLTMREAIIDTTKIITDKKIATNVANVVGKDGLRNITTMIDALADQNDGYNKTDGVLLGFLNQLGGGIQTVAVAGKITSVLIQPVSILFAVNKMGNVSGAKYISKAVYNMISNPNKIGDMISFAEEINPTIKASREDIEGSDFHNMRKLLPSRKYPVATPIVSGRNWISEKAFGMLAQVDMANKAIVTLAAYQQAINGEAPGIQATHAEAVKYAGNMVELTQTSNNIRNLPPIQREKYAKWALYFYSDLNNVYNNSIAVGRKAKQAFADSGNAAFEGDWKRAGKFARNGASIIGGYMLILTMAKMYDNLLRGQATPFDDASDKSPEEFLKEVGSFYLTSPVEVVNTLPFARDVNFAMQKYWEKKKTVDMPIDSALGSFATGLTGLMTLLDDEKDMSKREAKELLKSFGILTKLPTDALYTYLIKPDFEIPPVIEGQLQKVSKSITNYLKRNENNSDVPPEFKEQLEQLQQQIDPQETSGIPENSLDVLKTALSKGDALAYNEKTGAAGAFQFTEEQWSKIQKENPDLGLTENGRTSSDTSQQERAMDAELTKNAEVLKKAEIEVNNENLLASHLLGSKAVQVLKATGDTNLKTLVGEKFMQDQDFKNSFKVRDFKDWLGQQIGDAETVPDATQANN